MGALQPELGRGGCSLMPATAARTTRGGRRDGAAWGGPRAGEQVTRRHLELLFTSQGLGLENNNKTARVTFRAPGGGSRRKKQTMSDDSKPRRGDVAPFLYVLETIT